MIKKTIQIIFIIPLTLVWIVITFLIQIIYPEFAFELIGRSAEKAGYHRHV